MAFIDRSVISSFVVILPLILSAVGCGSAGAGGSGGAGGNRGVPFVPPEYGSWVKFEPEGAVCANGSQYKYFVNFSETSKNVVIFLEGGNACSSYASCTSGSLSPSG